MRPGATALTAIPFFDTSRAREIEKEMTAPLLAS
jgi:hypothetical protein